MLYFGRKQLLTTKKTEIMTELFFVQETVGGWRQNAMFSGTLDECRVFMAENCHNGSFQVVAESDYEVDYL